LGEKRLLGTVRLIPATRAPFSVKHRRTDRTDAIFVLLFLYGMTAFTDLPEPLPQVRNLSKGARGELLEMNALQQFLAFAILREREKEFRRSSYVQRQHLPHSV
jgi:hypothetical protein